MIRNSCEASTPKWHLNARILKRYCVWLGKILALVNYSRKAAVMAWIFYGDLPGAVISNSLTFHFSTPSVLIHSSNQKLFYIIDYGTGGSKAPRFKSSAFLVLKTQLAICLLQKKQIPGSKYFCWPNYLNISIAKALSCGLSINEIRVSNITLQISFDVSTGDI